MLSACAGSEINGTNGVLRSKNTPLSIQSYDHELCEKVFYFFL